MQREEPAQRRPRRYDVPHDAFGQLLSDQRDTGDGRHDLGERPVGPLVPREEIAGSPEDQYDEQQEDPDEPIGLPRRFVRGLEEHARHVHEQHDHDEVGRPVVEIPHQPAKRRLGDDVLNAGIGFLYRRPVEQRQQHPRDDQDDEEQVRDAAECVSPADVGRQTVAQGLA